MLFRDDLTPYLVSNIPDECSGIQLEWIKGKLVMWVRGTLVQVGIDSILTPNKEEILKTSKLTILDLVEIGDESFQKTTKPYVSM